MDAVPVQRHETKNTSRHEPVVRLWGPRVASGARRLEAVCKHKFVNARSRARDATRDKDGEMSEPREAKNLWFASGSPLGPVG